MSERVRPSEVVRAFVEAVVDLWRSLPERFEAWCDRFVMDAHAPLDVSCDEDGSDLICPRCKTAWPCEELMAFHDRRTEERRRAAEVAGWPRFRLWGRNR